MPERYEIRGQNLPDGNKALSPKDIYNVNKNFETIGFEVFGNINFTKKVKKEVDVLEEKTEAIIATVGDIQENYSTHTQTADSISTAIVNKAEKSEVTQLATDLTIKFSSIGGRNLLKNGGFEFGSQNWGGNSGIEEFLDGSTYSQFEGKNLLVSANAGVSRGIYQVLDLIIGKKYVFSVWILAENSGWISISGNDHTQFNASASWQKIVCKGVAMSESSLAYIIFDDTSTRVKMYIDNAQLEEGEVETTYSPGINEMSTTSYIFNSTGFEMKDNNGGVLIEASKGIANEQNFGRTENVESGYPLNMSFEIGDTTSLITSVKLKLKQYNFRTDSKGAKSGGGSTSGPSSRSTSESGASGDFTTATQTDLGYPNEGKHYHWVRYTDNVHSHGMAHTHSTPAHVHPIDFGILETTNTNGTIDVYIDDVWRTKTINTDTTLDITTWVTTNGVHSLRLESPNMKRIQCDVFIKSYIRR